MAKMLSACLPSSMVLEPSPGVVLEIHRVCVGEEGPGELPIAVVMSLWAQAPLRQLPQEVRGWV